MKKLILLIIVCSLVLVAGCGNANQTGKKLHCDNCQKEVTVEESSNMEEDWIIYCEECNEKLFGDDPILGGN